MSRKFPVVATLVCLLGVLILCALGAWQVSRLTWKNNLQAELDVEFSKALPDHEFLPADFDKARLQRGYVWGRPDMSKAILLHGRVANGRSLVSVLVPFKTDFGVTVPLEMACGEKIEIDKLRTIQVYEPMRFDGIIRPPKASYWAPKNNLEKDDWWRVDTVQLAAYWDVPKIEPVLLTAENIVVAGQDVTACPIEKTLPNNHLSYAIFWFTMAAVLCVMWGLRFLRPYLQSA